MKTVVLGAAGAIGKTVVPTLVNRGTAVRVVGRSEKRLNEIFGGLPVERVSADLSRSEDCARALTGMDAAVYTLGLPYTKTAFATYPVMMKAFLQAATEAGLKQLIHITNVYPYGKPRTARVSEDHPRVPVAVKGEYRKQQEDLVMAAHARHGLKTLTLRLPDFYGPDSESSLVHSVFDAAVRGKKAGVLGPVDTPHEFVFTRDVGPVVADLLERPELFGTAYNFAGPGVLSMREFTERVFAEAGSKVSYRVGKGIVLRLFGLFIPLLREMVEMEYLFKTPVILDDSRLKSVLPDMKKTSYEDGIRQTLAVYRKRSSR